jgi:Dyp-type peroxidase family
MSTHPISQPAPAPATPERDDIQGLIIGGYGRKRAAVYVLLHIETPQEARRWLGEIASELTTCAHEPDDACLNIAFTFPGLAGFGLSQDTLDDFPREFVEGMATPHRSRLLGDVGMSDPQGWEFGGPNNEEAHVLLMLFARDEAALAGLRAAHEGRWRLAGLRDIYTLPADVPPDRDSQRREHFGFSDGIAQPIVKGLERPVERRGRVIARSDNQINRDTIATGEIVLGYPNGYGRLPDSPAIDAMQGTDMLHTLPATARQNHDQSRRRSGQQAMDFGRNGSYLVFRQLRQDVRAFWRFVAQAAGVDVNRPDQLNQKGIDAAIRLASKMTGRWPGGAPLTLAPGADEPDQADANDFGYRDHDREGLKCPFGSHVRRTNPRDDMPEMATAELSTKVVNLHRILRRGRRYGKPLCPSFDLAEMIRLSLNDAADSDADEERGLIFACFNANIGRQFEFIQNTWVNNQKFAGLYEDADPITGFHDPFGTGRESGAFTIPAEPIRQRYTGLFSWVVTRGGAYFFMPGVNAVRFLAGV